MEFPILVNEPSPFPFLGLLGDTFHLYPNFNLCILRSSSTGYDTISNSCTMGCPPVRGDNPRALACGLSYVQVDKHGITILYHRHQCRLCTSRDISC